MFKKVLVFVLLCFGVGMFSACNDSSNNGLPIIPAITSIEGTYDVTFFGTSTNVPALGGDLAITSSCEEATKLGVTGMCGVTTKMVGEVVVSNENGQLKIISKLQMEGGEVENSPADKFQYTEYYPITPATDRFSGNGVGLKADNADATGGLTGTFTEFATSPFEFTLVGDVLTIKMTLMGKVTQVGTVDAKTTVVAKKRNNETTAPTKIGFWTNIEGTYDVTFFATSTFNGAIVIADNCTTAVEKGIGTETACNPLNKSTGVIVVSNDNGKLKIISKLQMEGGVVEGSPADKFQYTEYSSITPATDRLSGNGEGVVSYNLNTVTGELSELPVEFATSPFEFTLVGDVLTIKMTLMGKVTPVATVDAETTVIAKKKNNATTTPTKARFWAFSGVPEGTYDVTFFGTSTFNGAIVIADNCTTAVEEGIGTEDACNPLDKSTGVIVVSNDNGKLKIISKLQMEGGVVENSVADKFQYTEYSSITPATGRLSGNGTGLVGYNLDSLTGELAATPVEFATSPFEFTFVGDVLTIKMTLLGKVADFMGTPVIVDADTTVIAKKRNNETVAPTRARFWDFAPVTP